MVFIDRITRQVEEVYGKVIVMAGRSLDTTRILLNSKNDDTRTAWEIPAAYWASISVSRSWPATSRGSFRGSRGTLTAAAMLTRTVEESIFQNSAPRKSAKTLYADTASRAAAAAANFRGLRTRFRDWRQLQGRSKKYYATVISIGSFGEVIPRAENHVEIDPVVRDAWGIPVLKFEIEWGPNELAMARDAVDTQREMFKKAGIEIINERTDPLTPGWSIHSAGTARMGNDPKTSYLSKFNQSHDIKNLFVVTHRVL